MVKTYDKDRLSDIHERATHYLFQKGHTITKPMMDDIAIFIYDQQDREVSDATQTVTSVTYPERQLSHDQ
jgi:hypothetical protein